MSLVLFVVVPDATFATIQTADNQLATPQIQGATSMGGNTGYITGNLTPPGGTLYVMRLNANGTFLVTQSKQPAFVTALFTFFGWPVPA